MGYTNAGKSTLLNWFSKSEVLVENRLFATLDSTVRLVNLSPVHRILLSDTVGFIRKLLDFDIVIIAGQAKSHCMAWTIEDLLNEIQISDRKLAEKVYLLEDCTSPVVIPGVIDYTEQADKEFQKFSDAGMHVVRSSDPIVSWPGIRL